MINEETKHLWNVVKNHLNAEGLCEVELQFPELRYQVKEFREGKNAVKRIRSRAIRDLEEARHEETCRLTGRFPRVFWKLNMGSALARGFLLPA